MENDEFIKWARERGFVLGAGSCGHTGAKDAWTKSYGEHPALTVRYTITAKGLKKQTSRGFGSFATTWIRPMDSLRIVDGKLH